ncbi:hypothetical protein [Micromonospora sp. KLBMP9576]|uniref:hypothetical protein n=1 Tax=Micromonospora sp. KLBMP9576 TaxID=3424769 RepID=UPI003D926464
MPSVASVDPFWSVTLRWLRELTRLTVAALVLTVGLGGVSAASAPTPSAAAVPSVVATGAGIGQPPRREPPVEQVDDVAPSAARPADAPADTSAGPAVRPDGPARDPGRGVPGRRGPPPA